MIYIKFNLSQCLKIGAIITHITDNLQSHSLFTWSSQLSREKNDQNNQTLTDLTDK